MWYEEVELLCQNSPFAIEWRYTLYGLERCIDLHCMFNTTEIEEKRLQIESTIYNLFLHRVDVEDNWNVLRSNFKMYNNAQIGSRFYPDRNWLCKSNDGRKLYFKCYDDAVMFKLKV